LGPAGLSLDTLRGTRPVKDLIFTTFLYDVSEALERKTEEVVRLKKDLRLKDEVIQQREIEISCLRGQVTFYTAKALYFFVVVWLWRRWQTGRFHPQSSADRILKLATFNSSLIVCQLYLNLEKM